MQPCPAPPLGYSPLLFYLDVFVGWLKRRLPKDPRSFLQPTGSSQTLLVSVLPLSDEVGPSDLFILPRAPAALRVGQRCKQVLGLT